jgi:hypothetical protein
VWPMRRQLELATGGNGEQMEKTAPLARALMLHRRSGTQWLAAAGNLGGSSIGASFAWGIHD